MVNNLVCRMIRIENYNMTSVVVESYFRMHMQ